MNRTAFLRQQGRRPLLYGAVMTAAADLAAAIQQALEQLN